MNISQIFAPWLCSLSLITLEGLQVQANHLGTWSDVLRILTKMILWGSLQAETMVQDNNRVIVIECTEIWQGCCCNIIQNLIEVGVSSGVGASSNSFFRYAQLINFI